MKPRSLIQQRVSAMGQVGILALSLAGCAVGPDFHAPSAPPIDAITKESLPARTAQTEVAGGEAQQFDIGREIPGQWWQLYHSDALNKLVVEALKNNADLEAAQAALRSSRELYQAQKGTLFPTFGAEFAPQRQRNATGTLAPTLNSGQPVFNLYTAQLNVGYVLDVFGGARRAIESTEAQAEAQRYQMLATYLTLTSNVVAAAIQEASLRGQVKATVDIVRIEQDALGLLQRQYDLGQIAYGDVVAQQAALAQARSSLLPLQKQLAQQRTLLTALAGRYASQEIEETFDLSTLSLPTAIPVSLPSKLVEQRPDIQMAEAQLHYATAQVGVATANMLPQISITGTTGGVSTELAQLFVPGNRFWSIGADLTQPLFEGGMLLHKERAADALLDQARAQYRSVVIVAFENVADSLHALEVDADAVGAAWTTENAAHQSLDIARRQIDLGAANGLALLNAEQTLRQADINLILAQASRYADTAALFQSLGGGWSSADSPINSISEPKP